MGTTQKMLRLFTHELIHDPHCESCRNKCEHGAHNLMEDFSLTFRIHGAVASM